MNKLPADLRRYISTYTPSAHKVRVEFDVQSLAYAEETRNADDSYPLSLIVWMTLTFTLPAELDDEYIELMTVGRRMNEQVRIGRYWDNGPDIYNYLLQKQKEILKNDPQHSIQFVQFEDPADINDRDDRTITFPAKFTLRRQFLLDPRGQFISSEGEFRKKVQPVKQMCIDAIYYTIVHGQGFRVDENTYMLSPTVRPLFKSSKTPPVDAITFGNVKETVKDGDRTRSVRSRKKMYEFSGKVVGEQSLYETQERILSMYKLQDDASLTKEFLLGRFSKSIITVFGRIRVPENHRPGAPLQLRPQNDDLANFPDGIQVIPPVLPGNSFLVWTGLKGGARRDIFYITIVGNKQLPLGSGVQSGNTLVKLKL